MDNNNDHGQGGQESGSAKQKRGIMGFIHDHKEKKASEKAAKQPHAPATLEADYSSGTTQDTEQKSTYSTEKVGAEHHEHEMHKKTQKGADRKLEEGDEEQWNLDEAQAEIIKLAPAYQVIPTNCTLEQDHIKIAMQFIDNYPLLPGYHPQGRLTLPVVIPQRRPEQSSRGFVRAYAPELMNNGIDQTMFLDFIETFDLATQASPWLNSINLAGFSLIPLHRSVGVSAPISIALYLTVSLMRNMQSRKKYYTVLDKMNEEFYQPRGLYCMVLTWKPETYALEVGINVSATIDENLIPPEGLAKMAPSHTPSMGKTNALAFTDTAPLVFPSLDKLDDNDSEEANATKAKLGAIKAFAGEYFDRRAQAKLSMEAPESQSVAGPIPTFTSRYADPGNPSNKGNILDLLSTGKLTTQHARPTGPVSAVTDYVYRGWLGGYGYGFDPWGRPLGGPGAVGAGVDRFGRALGAGAGVGVDIHGHPRVEGFGGEFGGGYDRFNKPIGGDPLGMLGGLMGGGRMGRHDQLKDQQMTPNPGQLVSNGVKRILSEHVLYLLIVNMPTEKEMADAKKYIDRMVEHEHK